MNGNQKQGPLARAKALAIAFVVGLVAGPILTTVIGWQVSNYTLQRQVRAAVVDQQSDFCVERTRRNVERLGGLDYNTRLDLARKWALMPGQNESDYQVVTECSSKLGRIP